MTSLYWWLAASYLWIDTRTVNAFATTTRVVMPTNIPSSPHSMTLFAKTSHNNDNDDSFFLEQRLSQLKQPAMEYVTAFGLEQQGPSALLYALGSALKDLPLGFRGMPIVWKRNQLETIFGEEGTMIVDCFTMEHLETALEDDFLDAARGSTDNRRGWKVRAKHTRLFLTRVWYPSFLSLEKKQPLFNNTTKSTHASHIHLLSVFSFCQYRSPTFRYHGANPLSKPA